MPDLNGRAHLPIGVFDSGMGGLTVLRALRAALPDEDLLYLGDTARLPYGTKSAATVTRYALQTTAKLMEYKVKLLVIACNTATAAALSALRAAYPNTPVIGVVEPGAKAACAVSKSGDIAVIATESTIRNKAYDRAIHDLRPDFRVLGIPCPLFVPLAEEGWMDGPIVEAVAERYLAPIFLAPNTRPRPDTLILGCTHFPPLAAAIKNVIGNGTALVDSAATTTEAVKTELAQRNILRPPSSRPGGGLHFFTTDDAGRFAVIGSLFLQTSITPDQVDLVDL